MCLIWIAEINRRSAHELDSVLKMGHIGLRHDLGFRVHASEYRYMLGTSAIPVMFCQSYPQIPTALYLAFARPRIRVAGALVVEEY